MIVENVRGAIPWVGRSRWNFGSYHLWGDVPALMPITSSGFKVPGFRFDGSGSFQSASVRQGIKAPGMNWSDPTKRGQDFTRIAGQQQRGIKGSGGSKARKASSAIIAKIPLPLARHIGRSFLLTALSERAPIATAAD